MSSTSTVPACGELFTADRLERHRRDYATDGLTIIDGAIPGDLLRDLRIEAEKLRAIATRERKVDGGRRPAHGCTGYAEQGVDNSVFERFRQLPRLRQVIHHVLGPDFEVREFITMLFEGDCPRVQAFHRDPPHGVQPGTELWDSLIPRLELFNQFNAALYDDGSFWVVPGSHVRGDTAEEQRVGGGWIRMQDELLARMGVSSWDSLDDEGRRRLGEELEDAFPVPGRAGLEDGEYEAQALAYARSMPGARRVMLGAGDIAFYRQCGWHLGYYLPYHRRATLHGHARSPQVEETWKQVESAASRDVRPETHGR
jgi:hypothetical protein